METIICFIRFQSENLKMTWNSRLFLFHMIFFQTRLYSFLNKISYSTVVIKLTVSKLEGYHEWEIKKRLPYLFIHLHNELKSYFLKKNRNLLLYVHWRKRVRKNSNTYQLLIYWKIHVSSTNLQVWNFQFLIWLFKLSSVTLSRIITAT